MMVAGVPAMRDPRDCDPVRLAAAPWENLQPLMGV